MEGQKALKSPTPNSLHTSADDTDNDDVFVDVREDTMDDPSADWPSKCAEEKRCESALQSTDVSSNDTISQDVTPQSTSLTAEIEVSNGPETTNPIASSLDDVLSSEKEFIEYVLSLPSSVEEPVKSRSKKSSNRSVTKGSSGTKVGLDHLDNLCKLMEQLSELREANSKLQKRVQYLEDLKSLHEMHKEVNSAIAYEADNVLATEIPEKKMVHLDYICMESQEVVERPSSRSKERRYVVHKSKTQVNISRTQAGRTRERSKSVGHEEICDTKSKRIFPKWSRVKEALKFEKSPYARTVADYERKNQTTNERLVHSDQADILRVPIDSEDFQRDDDDSLTGDFYRVTGGYSPMAHSSMEDLRDVIEPNSRRGEWKSQSVYVTGKRSLEIPQDNRSRQKTPSPSYHTRDMAERRQKSLTLDRDLDPEQVFSKYDREEMKKSHKSPWGRVKTIIQSRKDSLRRRQRQNGGPRYMEGESNREMSALTETGEESNQRMYGKNPYFESSESSPNLSSGYAQNHSGSLEATDSDRIHRKYKPKPLRLPSPGGEESSHQDRPPSFYGDGDKELQRTPSSSPSYQQTEYPEISQSRCSSDSVPTHAKLVASHSAPVVDIMEELQRNLSEDFSRKIREWEKIRSGGPKLPSPKFERKGSGLKTRKVKQEKAKIDKQDKAPKHKMKDLNWLDKELQKIEKEKMRLAKEKQKYEERAKRLEKLRETVLNARTDNKKEVLVRTSAGEFRFQGISDAFTKKLYEWETKLGVGPELSTLALLDASFKTSPAGDRHAGIQRGLSKSESSIIEVGQPSHNSSNSLPSLKPDTDLTSERHQPSRANSEPELVSYGQQKEVKPARFQSGEVISNLPNQTYAPPEVTHLIDTDSEEGLTEKSDQQAQSDDNYYSLLEENVLLLEQLKNKEDICRRLERELGNLDLKMEEMNKHHKEELEKYKEKLWEIHGPRNKPRDTQACLSMLAKLKNRIEELESCGERLRNDRQNLEDSFRYHCQQQAQMTVDLIGKMKELQEVCSPKSNSGTTNSNNTDDKTVAIFDHDNVTRLHHLSTQLLKQTQNLEQALADRTREVCHLRWELLHRDVSAIRLHTELHRVRWQGGTARAAAKRAKFAEKRSLSSSERLFPWEKENETRQELPERLLQQSSEAYNEWSKVDFQTTGLTTTVHELNKELLKLSSKTDNKSKPNDSAGVPASNSETEKNQEENASDQQPAESINYCTVSLTSATEKCDIGQIKVRRNSADNISNLSEPLSLNDGERTVRPVQYQRKVSNISSSSESVGEECFTKVTIQSGKGSKRAFQKDSAQQLILQYPNKAEVKTHQCSQQQNDNNPQDKEVSMSPMSEQSSYKASKPEEKQQFSVTIQITKNSDDNPPLSCINQDSSSVAVSQVDQLKPYAKDKLIPRSQSSDYPHGNAHHARLNGEIGSDHNDSLKVDSPIIRSRSPRKLKREFSRECSAPPCNNDHRVLRKSISQPECGVKYTHLKRQNAPHVSSLIQKYNQKIMEHQGFSSHSTEQTPTGRNCAAQVKLNVNREESSTSSSSQTRVQNLRKAREEFISGSTHVNYTPPALNVPQQNKCFSEQSKYLYPDNDSLSTNSAISTDSVNLVMCRSAESCRESRMARRSLAERQPVTAEETSPPTSPTSPDIKPTGKSTHFLNFKLRKSKKKKELASISELCRQSLFLNIENAKSEDDKSPTVSPQSCPSSPELRPKPTKPKSSWLHKTIFKQTQS